MKKKRIYIETEEVVTTKRKGWIEIDLDYTQFYKSIFDHTKHLTNKWALKYILWVTPKANKENMIPHNISTIKEFIEEYKDSAIKPTVGTVKNAITELVKNNVLIKWGNSSYQLNPKLVWTDSIKKRIDHIKEKGKYDNYELIEEPLIDYKKIK